MICLYTLLDTKPACIFSKTQVASGVHVMRTSWKIFYFHSPHLAHAYLSLACITARLGLLPNVIKIREYVVKNRYERYHVCSFFAFFTAKNQKNT